MMVVWLLGLLATHKCFLKVINSVSVKKNYLKKNFFISLDENGFSFEIILKSSSQAMKYNPTVH